MRYEGYHDEHSLPIKRGDTVRIKKGTLVKRYGEPAKPAGRTYTITVHHMLCGSNGFGSQAATNPGVRWPGSGGYWMEVDINDVEKVVEGQ